MVWVVIERFVHLMTLVLLVLMIVIIFNNNKTGDERSSFSLQLSELREESKKVSANNINYLEGRINTLAEVQDTYQVSTSSKLYILEKKMDKLEQQSKLTPKVINNNNSNAVIYSGKDQQ
jgi:hypothetical protein